MTINNIIDKVAYSFGVSPEDIRSEKKKAEISNARQFAMYIMREVTNLTYEEIGAQFGGKKHSTVIYSIEASESKMEDNPQLKTTVYDIMKSIKSKQDITLSQSDCKKLLSYIEELKKDAENGREYRKELEKNFLRLMAVTEPHVPENCAKKDMSALSASELKLFNSALEKKAEGVLPIKPQLASAKNERSKTSQNKEFKI